MQRPKWLIDKGTPYFLFSVRRRLRDWHVADGGGSALKTRRDSEGQRERKAAAMRGMQAQRKECFLGTL